MAWNNCCGDPTCHISCLWSGSGPMAQHYCHGLFISCLFRIYLKRFKQPQACVEMDSPWQYGTISPLPLNRNEFWDLYMNKSHWHLETSWLKHHKCVASCEKVRNVLSHCYTKIRMGVRDRTHPHFGMTSTIYFSFLEFFSLFFLLKVGVVPKEGWTRPCTPILKGTHRASHMLPAVVCETPWWSP